MKQIFSRCKMLICLAGENLNWTFIIEVPQRTITIRLSNLHKISYTPQLKKVDKIFK